LTEKNLEPAATQKAATACLMMWSTRNSLHCVSWQLTAARYEDFESVFKACVADAPKLSKDCLAVSGLERPTRLCCTAAVEAPASRVTPGSI